jgi:DNA-binding MarR family transcriptional regulator
VKRKQPVFELAFQHRDEASKIVAAAERVGRALDGLLRRAAHDAGLSPLQARVVLFLDGQGRANRRPGRIARSLGVTAPTVTDALAALESKGLLARSTSAADARVQLLGLSPLGRRTAGKLARWADPARAALDDVRSSDRGEPLLFLMSWMRELLDAGIVSVARMCVTCRHFERDAHPGSRNPHHCRLLDASLGRASLRVDCPDHETAGSATG